MARPTLADRRVPVTHTEHRHLSPLFCTHPPLETRPKDTIRLPRNQALPPHKLRATLRNCPIWLFSVMQISGYRRIERRRSARVTLAVPLRVDGQAVSGEEFIIRTQSHTVSQFGCLIPLEAEVAPDQTVVLMNEHTRQSVQCRVVSTRRHRDGKRYLGIEFVSPKSNFWRIAFTKPGARSLKRQYGSLDSAH